MVLTDWAYHGEQIEHGLRRSHPRSKACIPEGFVLPVDDDESYTLFGAPLAFKTGYDQFVNDITHLLSASHPLDALPGMHHDAIRREMIAFLSKRSSYESFLDLPVTWGKDVVGVVALQSRQSVLFDESNPDDRVMLDSIQPFLDILAMMVIY